MKRILLLFLLCSYVGVNASQASRTSAGGSYLAELEKVEQKRALEKRGSEHSKDLSNVVFLPTEINAFFDAQAKQDLKGKDVRTEQDKETPNSFILYELSNGNQFKTNLLLKKGVSVKGNIGSLLAAVQSGFNLSTNTQPEVIYALIGQAISQGQSANDILTDYDSEKAKRDIMSPGYSEQIKNNDIGKYIRKTIESYLPKK